MQIVWTKILEAQLHLNFPALEIMEVFNFSLQTIQYERPSFTERLLSSTIFLLFCLCGILCYILVLNIMIKYRKTEFRNPFYTLAIALGISDMVYLGIVVLCFQVSLFKAGIWNCLRFRFVVWGWIECLDLNLRSVCLHKLLLPNC